MHPLANGQVEAANKMIKHHLKIKLGSRKGAWADELPSMLWAYRTTPYNATGKTSYFLAFKAKAVVPVEITLPNHWTVHFYKERNDDILKLKLDLLKENERW